MTSPIYEILQEISGQEKILVLPSIFIKLTGSLTTALFLSQAMYWSERSKHRGWFWKTYRDWQREIGLSRYQVRSAVSWLQERGIIEKKVKKATGGNPTVHYRVNDKALVKLVNGRLFSKCEIARLAVDREPVSFAELRFRRGEGPNCDAANVKA